MENKIQNRIPRQPIQDPQSWKNYSIAEKYFYLVLCYLIKRYGYDGRVVSHDTIIKNGVPSFGSFHISQRICKGSRKKLEKGGLIAFRHIYGERGYRSGTEYALCEAAYRESPKEIHALIFNKRSPELPTPILIQQAPQGYSLYVKCLAFIGDQRQ